MKEHCPYNCNFRWGQNLCETVLKECWHHGDKPVKPFDITLEFPRYRMVVTVVGENDLEDPSWILTDHSYLSKRAPWIKEIKHYD